MIIPVQITFRNIPPSPAVEARVRKEVEKLERYYDRITRCRVMIEAPHRHQKWGMPFRLRIDLGVPHGEIVVKHEPSLRTELAHSESGRRFKHFEADGAHRDLYVTIRDAFDVARRQLEDHVRRLRGDVKLHARTPVLRREKLRR